MTFAERHNRRMSRDMNSHMLIHFEGVKFEDGSRGVWILFRNGGALRLYTVHDWKYERKDGTAPARDVTFCDDIVTIYQLDWQKRHSDFYFRLRDSYSLQLYSGFCIEPENDVPDHSKCFSIVRLIITVTIDIAWFIAKYIHERSTSCVCVCIVLKIVYIYETRMLESNRRITSPDYNSINMP